jgi:chromosome partitioning protein
LKKIKLKKIATFGHDKGGVGKSTTAINIAVLANADYELTVIDLDPKRQFTVFNSNRKDSKKINQFEPKNKKELVQFAKDYDGLILIDLGGFDSDMFRTALLISDIVIVPLSNSDNDVLGLKDFNKILLDIKQNQEKNNIDFEVAILLNRIHHANKSAHKGLSKYAAKYGFSIFNTVVRNNAIFENMLFCGKSVTEQTKEKPAKIVKKLYKELKEKLEK